MAGFKTIKDIKPKIAQKGLTPRAKEYFGGKNASFAMTRAKDGFYELWRQAGKKAPARCLRVTALDDDAFARKVNSMAAADPGNKHFPG